MFTGLIQAVGRLVAHEPRGGDLRVQIGFADLERAHIVLGESIAVSGVCLTVVAFDGETFAADVSNETLALTTLGTLPVGTAVNLERALRASDRLGGHMVSGHVDGIGHVAGISDDGRSQRWRFSAASDVLRFIASKGSVAIDGVSLTVNAVDEAGFEVNLVPHTIAHTAFAQNAVGGAVNIEVDVVARYVERLLQTRAIPSTNRD
ncbi:MAG: riboflavin synthase [Lysobacterales bacterium CG17_big_fil_post_rev_8_21_14_2_50_64_11]|nr:MAG: riboflavin synthase [Xanthomonadales bacterium CG17_big_fil_post_rev_8_21_14_2_50_64_11]PIX59446.1 MAG: riboflavin synthase [Xanthomonadales bacterium CG_4_10_14_3_um_filter_64_11]